MVEQGALRLVPHYAERVWGGQRLKPDEPPVGEAWIVWEENRVSSGPDAGRTLADLAAERGAALLGRRAVERTGTRFPLLIKLLDTADWLSLQVHPRDEQAVRLEGPGHFGKTEAWHILEADAGAELICGLRPGTPEEVVAQAIRDGTILDQARYLPATAGDTIFVAAGTIHALGPGLLLYEVQQTSDITYRVFDWNRPRAAGRALHLDKSVAVTDPLAVPAASPRPELDDGAVAVVTRCPYFTLALMAGRERGVESDPAGETFHAITVVEGSARVAGDGWSELLHRFESVVVPAAAGTYRVEPVGEFLALRASVE